MDEYISKEKAIQELREVYENEYPTASGDFDEYAIHDVPNALRNIPAADVQPVDRWIDAQKNPPIATDGETSDYVLVLRADGRQCVCYYVYDDDDGNYWCSEDEKSMYDIDEVTHWQPLPEPPKDGDMK